MNLIQKAEQKGYFGPYGGAYVPEMMRPALEELAAAYQMLRQDPVFLPELDTLLCRFVGRPSPLLEAERWQAEHPGVKILLKLESHNHTGAHKINNVLGQMLLARRMGKKEIVAETGAGQHGLATAAGAAKLGLPCKVFMGAHDVQRQHPNVFSMKLMGAEVISVESGNRTLRDAVNAAMKYWIEHQPNAYYLLGSVLGPHPYPSMVRDFQSVIGREVRTQLLAQYGLDRPDLMVACVGGGSNAMGFFNDFLSDEAVCLVGVEAGGESNEPGRHARRFGGGFPGVAQGYRSYFLQEADGQLLDTHSLSAGLDYAGVGPQLAELHDSGRIEFVAVSDEEALDAYRFLACTEGIIPALESAHAVAQARKTAAKLKPGSVMVVNISGRGDKDLFITAPRLDRTGWFGFLQEEVRREKDA
jgi:tryptophan synthase beta chain